MDGNMFYDAMRYQSDREAATARATIRKLWITVIALIAVLALLAALFTIAYIKNDQKWRDYLSQYDFESYEVVSNDGGDANFIGNNGDINYGVYKSSPQNEESFGG